MVRPSTSMKYIWNIISDEDDYDFNIRRSEIDFDITSQLSNKVTEDDTINSFDFSDLEQNEIIKSPKRNKYANIEL